MRKADVKVQCGRCGAVSTVGQWDKATAEQYDDPALPSRIAPSMIGMYTTVCPVCGEIINGDEMIFVDYDIYGEEPPAKVRCSECGGVHTAEEVYRKTCEMLDCSKDDISKFGDFNLSCVGIFFFCPSCGEQVEEYDFEEVFED